MNELENKIEQLEKYIEVREQEIEELQDKIDKAIAYLESNEHTCNYVDIYNYALREEDLLNILKGDNK